MGSMKKWMLGTALALGALAMTAAPAQAAHIGVFIGAGAPVAYVPPSPGPGYVWVDGYWANGYWVPGYWNFAGYGPRVVVRGGFGWDHDWDRGRDYYRHDFDRHDYDRHDFDRHYDRDDHFRR